jgi:hypothetical protein
MMGLYDTRMNFLGTENAFRIGPYIRQIETQGKKVVKFNIGEPDFPAPSHIKDEIGRHRELDNTHYCDPRGFPFLRFPIAKHLSETHGITVNPDRIICNRYSVLKERAAADFGRHSEREGVQTFFRRKHKSLLKNLVPRIFIEIYPKQNDFQIGKSRRLK